MMRRLDLRAWKEIFRVFFRIAVMTTLAFPGTIGTAHSADECCPLPRSKAMLMPCREAALKLQPGVIENITTRVHREVYYYVFLIRAPDGTRKRIPCDAATGKAVKSLERNSN
jgi:hypothetical protein